MCIEKKNVAQNQQLPFVQITSLEETNPFIIAIKG